MPLIPVLGLIACEAVEQLLYGESWDNFFNEQDWNQVVLFQGIFIADVYRKQKSIWCLGVRLGILMPSNDGEVIGKSFESLSVSIYQLLKGISA